MLRAAIARRSSSSRRRRCSSTARRAAGSMPAPRPGRLRGGADSGGGERGGDGSGCEGLCEEVNGLRARLLGRTDDSRMRFLRGAFPVGWGVEEPGVLLPRVLEPSRGPSSVGERRRLAGRETGAVSVCRGIVAVIRESLVEWSADDEVSFLRNWSDIESERSASASRSR